MRYAIRRAIWFVVAGVLVGWPAIISAQLVSFDNKAAWDAQWMSLPGAENFFEGTVTDFSGLDFAPLPHSELLDFGNFTLFVDAVPSNTSFGIGGYTPTVGRPSSPPGLIGIFFDEFETLAFGFLPPVRGFYFTIQRWGSSPVLPNLSVHVDGSPAADTSTAGAFDGFYGVIGTSADLMSFTLAKADPFGPPEDFVIDDIGFVFEDIIMEPDPDLTFIGGSGAGPTDFEDPSNWLGTFSGTLSEFAPDAGTNASFNSLAGFTSITLPLSGASARTMDIRDQTFTFSAGTPSAPLTVAEFAGAGLGVAIGDDGVLVCSTNCDISVSNAGNTASTVIEATGTLTVGGGDYGTDQLDNSAGGTFTLSGGRVEVGAGGFQPAGDDVTLGDGDFVLRDGGSTIVAGTLLLTSTDPASLMRVTGSGSQLTIGDAGGPTQGLLEMGSAGSFEVLDGATVTIIGTESNSIDLSTGRELRVSGGGRFEYDRSGPATASLQFDGPINISGANSTVDIGAAFDVGSTMNITSGGSFRASFFDIGGGGAVIVDGNGSDIHFSLGVNRLGFSSGGGSLTIRNDATGTLDSMRISRFGSFESLVSIESGAQVTAERFEIASVSSSATGSGVLTVTDSGTILTVHHDFFESFPNSTERIIVGKAANGSATVNVLSGAVFNAGRGNHEVRATGVVNVGIDTTPGGTLNIDSNILIDTGSVRSVNGGTLNVANTITLDGDGTLDVVGSGAETPGSANIGAVGVAPSGTLHIGSSGSLRGVGNVIGNVINAGLVAPGFSPGIIVIEGDYSGTSPSMTEPGSTLEIEIAPHTSPGTPGIDYDQLQVTGTATLAGRLDVPLLDGFVPSANDEVIAITAESVVGQFDLITSPNLGSSGAGLAIDVIVNATDVRIRFVTPDTSIQFIRTDPGTLNWDDETNWTVGMVPGSTNNVALGVLAAAGAQGIDVPSASNALANEVSVAGTPGQSFTLNVGGNFSAVNGLLASDNGTLQLTGGTVAASEVTLENGARLEGNGNLIGNLSVGEATGEAMVSPGTDAPGMEVGTLEITGDYQQMPGGTLDIDIEGATLGDFDTIAVTGQVTPGGTLRIDATNLGAFTPGTTLQIISAGGLDAADIFASVETVGNTDLYFAPVYNTTPGTGSLEEGGALAALTTSGGVSVTGFPIGDMNQDNVVDVADVQDFALALTDPLEYFSQRFVFGDQAAGNLSGPNGVADGRLDFDDIDAFAALIEGMSSAQVLAAIQGMPPAVPEPGTLVMGLAGMAALVFAGKARCYRAMA